jgi:hypothetical protein
MRTVVLGSGGSSKQIPTERKRTMSKKPEVNEFNLDEYVSPIIDGGLGEGEQNLVTNVCDSGCAPKPK